MYGLKERHAATVDNVRRSKEMSLAQKIRLESKVEGLTEERRLIAISERRYNWEERFHASAKELCVVRAELVETKSRGGTLRARCDEMQALFARESEEWEDKYGECLMEMEEVKEERDKLRARAEELSETLTGREELIAEGGGREELLEKELEVVRASWIAASTRADEMLAERDSLRRDVERLDGRIEEINVPVDSEVVDLRKELEAARIASERDPLQGEEIDSLRRKAAELEAARDAEVNMLEMPPGSRRSGICGRSYSLRRPRGTSSRPRGNRCGANWNASRDGLW